MKYRAIPREQAQQILTNVRTGGDIREGDYVVRGEGEELELRRVDALGRKLRKTKKKYPEVLSRKDPAGARWEAECCVLVHDELDLDVEVASDYEFWIWLALHLNDLVEWRHGGRGKPAKLANYGIGDNRENLFHRMWLRADIGYSTDKRDPYALARRGGNEFWRSHILRTDFGKCRPVARAWIQAQFPKARATGTWKIVEYRDIAKRLNRLHPTLMFEALDESAALALIHREAQASLAALGK